MALPRERQASDIGEVEYAILETTGHLGLLNAEKAQVEHRSVRDVTHPLLVERSATRPNRHTKRFSRCHNGYEHR